MMGWGLGSVELKWILVPHGRYRIPPAQLGYYNTSPSPAFSITLHGGHFFDSRWGFNIKRRNVRLWNPPLTVIESIRLCLSF